MKMKYVAIIGIVFGALVAHHAAAQNTAGASSGSSSSVGVTVESNSTVYGDTYRTDGTQTIKSAPAVSAPAVFGGGHPCLAGRSGGLSVIGGGLSYGQGDAEPACMAWIMGNPEIALTIMMDNPRFRAAACKMGFYRVGNTQVPVQCGEQLPARASSRSTAPAAAPTQAVCERRNGKLRYTVDAGFANKQAARKACLATLRG